MDDDLDLLQPPMAEAATQFLVDKLVAAMNASTKVIVEHENFQVFVAILDSIKQMLVDFEEAGDIFQLEILMRKLEQDIDEALELIAFCTFKSRIYLLLHCRTISKQLEDVTRRMGRCLATIPPSSLRGDEQLKAVVDDLSLGMTEAVFPYKDNEAKLCQTLEPENSSILSDVGVQQAILMDIGRTVGIEDLSRNPSAFRIELDLLRKDVENSKDANDVRLFDVVSGMFDKWLQSNEQPGQSEEAHAVHLYHKRLEAFVCPLTNQVMQDPVTLENGQTYERIAIEGWIQKCKEDGRRFLCPVTGQEVSTVVKPSLGLRNAIEEWTQRNEQARFEIVRHIVTSKSDDADIAFGLSDLQTLCRKNPRNKLKVLDNKELIPLIIDLLKKGEEVRCLALSTLRLLAENDDDCKNAIGAKGLRDVVICLSQEHAKEREGAVYLLYELSKSDALCNKIGATTGAILVLVGILSSNSEDLTAVDHAELTLANLERCDNNLKQLAESGRLEPLFKRLVEGSEEVRIGMAEDLSVVHLTFEDKSRAAQSAALALVEMLNSHNPMARAAALKALRNLSALPSYGNLLIEAGVLAPLMRDLFVLGATQVPKQKEISASVLANVVSSGANWETVSVDRRGNTLTSEDTVRKFLQLIGITGPTIEAKVLQVLVGLASSSKAVTKVVQHIRSAAATESLIQFLEAPHPDLRVTSVRLLMLLSPHMGQELADGLRVPTGQLGTLIKLLASDSSMEEQAVAAGLLANLPMKDIKLTQAMLDKDAPALLIQRLKDLKSEFVRVGDRRHIIPFQTGIVGILVRFTYALDEQKVLDLAMEHDFTELFTSLLQNGRSDGLQISAALALENLSMKSSQLSTFPDPPQPKGIYRFACFKKPTPLLGICPVHSGVCTAKETFCLVHANALSQLVLCLDHINPGVVEAAIGALSTLLMDTVDIERGSQVLQSAGGIPPILLIMQEHRTEVLRQRAVWMVERVLRNADLAHQISGNAHVNTALIDAFHHGNNRAKQLAERALKHLKKIPNFSGVFPQV